MHAAGFGNKYDKWDKVIYHGQELAFYGREGKGPGAYFNMNDADKVGKSSMRFTIARVSTKPS